MYRNSHTDRYLKSEANKTISFINVRSSSPNCQKCGEMTFSPLTCDSCGLMICAKCTKTSRSIIHCPICHKPFNSFIRFSQSVFNKLEFKKPCRYTQKGCKFVFLDDTYLEHEKYCRFQPYKCPNKGCTEKLLKKDKQKHELECKLGSSACEFCKELILNINKISHLLSCNKALKSDKFNSPAYKKRFSILALSVAVCTGCNREMDKKETRQCNNCQKTICINCTKACLFCKAYYCHKCAKTCPHVKNYKEVSKEKTSDLTEFIMKNLHVKGRFRRDVYLWKIANLFRYIKNKGKLKISKLDKEFEKTDENSMIKINKILKLNHSISNIEFCFLISFLHTSLFSCQIYCRTYRRAKQHCFSKLTYRLHR